MTAIIIIGLFFCSACATLFLYSLLLSAKWNEWESRQLWEQHMKQKEGIDD